MLRRKGHVGQYKIGKTIGKGAFGKVKYAVDTITGEPVAIKIQWKRPVLNRKMINGPMANEVEVLKRVRQKNVVMLKHILVGRFKLYVVFELVEGGELFHRVATEGRLGEDESRGYFQQLVEGVEYCHSVGVFHRDLKPENLLLTNDGLLKITDFGLSALREMDGSAERMLETTCGTPQYVAPEVLLVEEKEKSAYSGGPADVWSMGVILYVMLAGYLPFHSEDRKILYNKIKTSEFSFPKWMSEDARHLLDCILVPDPKKRYTIEEIKKHRWFAKNFVPSAAPPLRSAAPSDELFEDVGEEEEEKKVDVDLTRSLSPGKKKMINAFALVSLSGAFNISPLLDATSRKEVIQPDHFSSMETPSRIRARLLEELEKLNYDVHLSRTKRKIKTKSKDGRLKVRIEIMQATETLFIIDFMRTEGDYLAFSSAAREIIENVKDLRAKEKRKSD